ncbi:MAG: T9SS type A sorting domain-containing protein [Flavobacterium sp.]|nr:T9SS type A sorting domain-containing protein [Flavobacterium sp.]
MKLSLHKFGKIVVVLVLMFSSSIGMAQFAGFNSTFIVLETNGGGNTYYDLKATTSNIDFDNANLGNFCTASGNSLIFKGAEHNNYKCGGCDITSTSIYYRIYPTGSPSGSFISNYIDYFSGFNNGCGGADQQWKNVGYNNDLLAGLSAGSYTMEVYSDEATTCSGTIYASNNGANFKANFTVLPTNVYYADADGDGFGNGGVYVTACTAPPGYVSNSADCNDNQLAYTDNDGDGFGVLPYVSCYYYGSLNNLDSNDNQLNYTDNDGDGFGAYPLLPVGGVLNASDCNDNQLAYTDSDGDGFGVLPYVSCYYYGALNNLDSNDAQLNYTDNDGDGFGAYPLLPVGGVLNASDCNDNQLAYTDSDGDGFGVLPYVSCYYYGVLNNLDSNDAQLNYTDNDGDGFGASPFLPVGGVLNASDCNDNQLVYTDSDGDGFGVLPYVACYYYGVLNNTDCNDSNASVYQGNTLYVDADGDGYTQGAGFACYGATIPTGFVTTSLGSDCDDNNAAVYQSATLYIDLDGDHYTNGTAVVCYGATFPAGYSLTSLGTDCNDNNPALFATFTYYADADGDGFGNPNQSVLACSQPTGYVVNGTDCDDTKATVNPGAVEVCNDGLDNNCDGLVDNGCSQIVTTISASQCGITLAAIDTPVYANLVSGAQGYRFKVTNLSTGLVQSLDRFLRVFNITSLPVYAFATTYQVEVSVKIGGVWSAFYGAPCTVSTPATTTKVQASQCGSSITHMNDVIYADLVPFAKGYRFRATNILTLQQQIVDRQLRDFRMSLLTAPEYNSIYTIEVAVKNTNGTYLPYGQSCNITTPSFPTTFLQASQCDYTASSLSEVIYANNLTNATAYRFKLVNIGFGYNQFIERSTRTFSLNMFTGLLPATTYNVQVSAKINGIFGPYGKVCSVTTPGSARAIETGNSLSTIEFKAVAYPNPFADNFKLDVNSTTDNAVKLSIYDMLGRQIENREVPVSEISTLEIGSNLPSGVYNVIVNQGENSQILRVIKR